MVIKKTLSYLLARGLPGLISLLAIMVYTRILTPEVYGQYAIVMSLIVLTITLCFQWMQFSILRFYPKAEISEKALLSNLAYSFIFVSLLIFPLFTIVLYYTLNFLSILLLFMVVVLTFFHAFFDMSVKLLIAKGEAFFYGLLLTSKAVSALILGVLLVYSGLTLMAPLIALTSAYFLLNLLVIKKLWLHKIELNIDKKLLKSMLYYGLPLSGTFLMDYVMSNSDRLMLAWLKGEESAGLYAAGYDVSNFSLMVIMMSVHYAVYPMILKAYEENKSKLSQQLLGHNLIALLLAIIPLILVLVYLVVDFSQLIFGKNFWHVSSEIIPIVTLATLFLGLKAFYFDLCFLIKQRTKPLLYIALLGAIINLILNYGMINQYGIVGAAYATCITYFIIMCLSYVWGNRLLQLSFPIKDILLVTLVLILTWLVLFTGHLIGIDNFFVDISLMLISYSVLVYAFNLLDFRVIINTHLHLHFQRDHKSRSLPE